MVPTWRCNKVESFETNVAQPTIKATWPSTPQLRPAAPHPRNRTVFQSRSESTPFPLYDATLIQIAKSVPVFSDNRPLSPRLGIHRAERLWRKAKRGQRVS